jgi:hypothetical protein
MMTDSYSVNFGPTLRGASVDELKPGQSAQRSTADLWLPNSSDTDQVGRVLRQAQDAGTLPHGRTQIQRDRNGISTHHSCCQGMLDE